MCAHDALESKVLRYMTLRIVTSGDFKFGAGMTSEVTQLLARLQHEYGSMLPKSIHVGPAVRLTRQTQERSRSCSISVYR